jgi:hypothetical protein
MASSFAGISERLDDTGNSLQEREIKVEHAKEMLKIFSIKRKREVMDGLDARGRGERPVEVT